MTEDQKKKMEALASARITPSMKSLKNKDDQYLKELIEQLCEVEAYVEAVNNFGVNLLGIEEKWINIISELLTKSYGVEVSDIIVWWVFESIDEDGSVLPITIEENGEEKDVIIKTPLQLVNFLKKYIIK